MGSSAARTQFRCSLAGHFSEAVHFSGNETITRLCWLGLMQPRLKKAANAAAMMTIRPLMCSDYSQANHPAKGYRHFVQKTAPPSKPRVCSTCFAYISERTFRNANDLVKDRPLVTGRRAELRGGCFRELFKLFTDKAEPAFGIAR